MYANPIWTVVYFLQSIFRRLRGEVSIAFVLPYEVVPEIGDTYRKMHKVQVYRITRIDRSYSRPELYGIAIIGKGNPREAAREYIQMRLSEGSSRTIARIVSTLPKEQVVSYTAKKYHIPKQYVTDLYDEYQAHPN